MGEAQFLVQCSEFDRVRESLDPVQGRFLDGIGPLIRPQRPSQQSGWPILDEAAYQGLMGEIVRTLDPHTEADPVAVMVQLLVAFGNVIGRHAYFIAEADHHYMNMYAAIVGLTSKGRKGTSFGQVNRIYKLVDDDWVGGCQQNGLSSGEGLIFAVRDESTKQEAKRKGNKYIGDYQSIVVDHGVVDKRLFVVESEFGGTIRVMRRDGSTLSAVIRQAWDTGDLKTMTKNSATRATGAHISILAHITQDELIKLLDRTETSNGFANRFLWLCVRRSKTLPEGGNLEQSQVDALAKKLRNAVIFARDVGELRRDDVAREMWREAYPRLSEGHPGLLGAVTSRSEAQVMRLACIYALVDQSRVVKSQHLLAALALWRYAEQSAKYIFGQRLGNTDADDILAALRQTEAGMTKTDFRDLFQRNRTASQIDRALELLQQNGLASFRKEGSTGRHAERWFATYEATAKQRK